MSINLFSIVKQRLQARKNRRTAVRMLMASGLIRRGDKGIRYGMTQRELAILMKEDTQ